MLLIVVLWFGISPPLSAIGAYFGAKHNVGATELSLDVFLTLLSVIQAIRHPVRVNAIPRQIPPTPKYLRPWVIIFIPSQLSQADY
jgi:transmembrane 9 superfamily protein 2/4